MLERLTTPMAERFTSFRFRRAKEQDPLDRLFLEANPNPSRIGCPGRSVLKELAFRKFPTEHPAEDHLTECSPCFEEYLELRNQYEGRRRRTAALMVAVVAAAALFLIVLAIQFWPRPVGQDLVQIAANSDKPIISGLDYGSPIVVQRAATEPRH
jgi:hypothetical protein